MNLFGDVLTRDLEWRYREPSAGEVYCAYVSTMHTCQYTAHLSVSCAYASAQSTYKHTGCNVMTAGHNAVYTVWDSKFASVISNHI